LKQKVYVRGIGGEREDDRRREREEEKGMKILNGKITEGKEKGTPYFRPEAIKRLYIRR